MKSIDSKVTIIIDGDEFPLEWKANEENIVNSAEEAGIDAPYSCLAGVCSTCKAKILEGKVHMEENFTLDDDEIEEGFVLACQCKPLTETVVISFDVL